MYYVKMTFTPSNKINITENNIEDDIITGRIWNYLGNMSRYGQIFKDMTLIYEKNVFHAFFLMPEIDSLDEKNCHRHTVDALADVRKKFGISTEILGSNSVVSEVCMCDDPSWYVLYGRRDYAFSPIVCGDCLKMIPAYKFLHIELPLDCPSEFGWLEDYCMINQLWFRSSFDRFTYRQMNDPESQLSKSGRKICAFFEKETKKPYYYHLFHYSDSKKNRGLCPDCGGNWILKESIGSITYKCDKCRLVSS